MGCQEARDLYQEAYTAAERAAFEKVAPYDHGIERRVLELRPVAHRAPLRLAPAGTESKRSLDSGTVSSAGSPLVGGECSIKE